MKRIIGEIWKDKEDWMVQFPKGRMSFRTKREATKWQLLLRKEANQ